MRFKSCLRSIILIVLVCLIASCGYIGKGCRTADKMMDQTIFNADKNVWTYEQFYETYERYNQYTVQIEEAEQRLTDLKEEVAATGILDPQEKKSLIMERDGARQMRKEVAKQYNKMSDVCYQKIWKGRGLPQRLEY